MVIFEILMDVFILKKKKPEENRPLIMIMEQTEPNPNHNKAPFSPSLLGKEAVSVLEVVLPKS